MLLFSNEIEVTIGETKGIYNSSKYVQLRHEGWSGTYNDSEETR